MHCIPAPSGAPCPQIIGLVIFARAPPYLEKTTPVRTFETLQPKDSKASTACCHREHN